MTTALIKYYLEDHPKEAAPIIDNANQDVMLRFLQALDTGIRANLLGQLLPNTVRHYLLAEDPQIAAQTLAILRASTIAHILQGLSVAERAPILDSWTDEKRESVRHQLRYPRDSVGAILITPTPACRENSTVRQAKRLVRRLSSPSSVLAVLDEDMYPVGLLDFSQLLRLREREIIGHHMRRIPRPFKTRVEISVAAQHSAWMGEDFLPAVGSDEKFAGLISKSQLLHYLEAQRPAAETEDELLITVMNLAELFLKPAAEFMATAMAGTRGERR